MEVNEQVREQQNSTRSMTTAPRQRTAGVGEAVVGAGLGRPEEGATERRCIGWWRPWRAPPRMGPTGGAGRRQRGSGKEWWSCCSWRRRRVEGRRRAAGSGLAAAAPPWRRRAARAEEEREINGRGANRREAGAIGEGGDASEHDLLVAAGMRAWCVFCVVCVCCVVCVWGWAGSALVGFRVGVVGGWLG